MGSQHTDCPIIEIANGVRSIETIDMANFIKTAADSEGCVGIAGILLFPGNDYTPLVSGMALKDPHRTAGLLISEALKLLATQE